MDLCFKNVALAKGMSELQYAFSLFEHLEQGDLIDFLNIEGQTVICDWINDNHLLNGKPFVVKISFLTGRNTNVIITCLCKMDFRGEEPKISVQKNVIGLSLKTPPEFDNLPSYDITLPMLMKDGCAKES
jgi:hypothetical protein